MEFSFSIDKKSRILASVKINNVIYQDNHGTSATEVAVKFECSPKHPCSGVSLEDTYENKINKPNRHAFRNHAGGITSCMCKCHINEKHCNRVQAEREERHKSSSYN